MSDSLDLVVTDENLKEASEFSQVLKIWEEKYDSADFVPTQYLTRMSEIIEDEFEQYMKLDPDPFDDRHPCRTHTQCAYGQSLKALFKKDAFIDKLVNHYLKEKWGINDLSVNTAACRLFVGILPGLETSTVFQETDDLVLRLYKWSETAPDPLRSYALGILGASMETPEVATKYRDQNVHLLPLTLCRIRGLQAEMMAEFDRPFSQFSKCSQTENINLKVIPSAQKTTVLNGPTNIAEKTTVLRTNSNSSQGAGTPIIEASTPTNVLSSGIKRKRPTNNFSDSPLSAKKRSRLDALDDDEIFSEHKSAFQDIFDFNPCDIDLPDGGIAHRQSKVSQVNDCSSSSWVELESNMIGTMKIFPLTPASKQILTLRYLSPLGEYQDMLSFAFKNNALELILNYLDVFKTKDSRLTFEALRYLSSLLIHKKFAVEFIRKGGLLKLLKIPRPSISSDGVAICLHFVSYTEDAMERICMMPKAVLSSLVSYGIWLLECSHSIGRNYALMFFGNAYPFRILLDLFDSNDGLRVIVNIISTLPNFLTDVTETEENQYSTRLIVRHVVYNLRRYFECHLTFLAEKIRRQQQISSNFPSTTSSMNRSVEGTSPYKAVAYDAERLRELNNFILEIMPLWARWHPVEKLVKLGGLQHLMQIIAFAYDWNYPGRGETVKTVLDILGICSLVPRVQSLFTERITLQGSNNLACGISIILSAAEGEVAVEPDVQRSALLVIGNCVSGPLVRNGIIIGQFQQPNPVSKTPKKSGVVRTCEDLLNKIWESVRVNNGILVLTRLLMVKSPIRDADSLRALACWCLAGLARYVRIRQVLAQLPIMQSGLIQMLMREPVLQENRQDHALFQKYALELIKLVYGKVIGVEYDLNVVAVQKSDVISQSKINYNEKQLLELIREHLLAKGLTESASMLSKEAKLFEKGSSQSLTLASANSNLQASNPVGSNRSSLGNCLPLVSPCRKGKVAYGFQSPSPKVIAPSPSTSFPSSCFSSIGTNIGAVGKVGSSSNERSVTLDTIVTEYLTNQHSLCKTPMAICPTFDLVIPHKCPAPKLKVPNINIAARFGRPSFDWSTSASLNKKLTYSKFKPIRVLRSPEEDHFTTACFSSCNQWAIVGTHGGEIKLINILSGNEDGTYSCHDSQIHHVQPNSKGNLLLTSSIWRRPLSKLWRMDTLFDGLIEFDREDYVEFSKLNQDKIIGTNMETATVYDITTGVKLLTLEPKISNSYIKNRATFDPYDDLILSDGVLWDFKSGKEIHKFDKLNESINGVFHPTGLEIIANSEVWDVRTFKLLRTVKALDQCNIVFTNDGTIIYGTKCEKETTEGFRIADTNFVTIDATNYDRIGTIELKRNIHSLATSPNDLQIALVENSGSDENNVKDSCVRFYEVGRSRVDEEEVIDADEEDDEEELQSGDSDDDDEDEDGSETGFDVDRLLDELLPAENEEFEEQGEEETSDEDDDGVELILESDSEDEEDRDENVEANEGSSSEDEDMENSSEQSDDAEQSEDNIPLLD